MSRGKEKTSFPLKQESYPEFKKPSPLVTLGMYEPIDRKKKKVRKEKTSFPLKQESYPEFKKPSPLVTLGMYEPIDRKKKKVREGLGKDKRTFSERLKATGIRVLKKTGEGIQKTLYGTKSKKSSLDTNATEEKETFSEKARRKLRNFTLSKEEEKRASPVSLKGTISKMNRNRKRLEETLKQMNYGK